MLGRAQPVHPVAQHAPCRLVAGIVQAQFRGADAGAADAAVQRGLAGQAERAAQDQLGLDEPLAQAGLVYVAAQP